MFKKRKSGLPKTKDNLIMFCKFMEGLPLNFRFKLTNTGKGFDGYWVKTSSSGSTVWKKGSKVLSNSSFFTINEKVFESIKEKGFLYGEVDSPDRRYKIVPPLTKDKVKELYYRQGKSLREIGSEYGCSKQNIMRLMKRYGLKRRTKSEARMKR